MAAREYFGGLRGELWELAELADDGKVCMRYAMKGTRGRIVAFGFRLQGVAWSCQANAGAGKLYAFCCDCGTGIEGFKQTIGIGG